MKNDFDYYLNHKKINFHIKIVIKIVNLKTKRLWFRIELNVIIE